MTNLTRRQLPSFIRLDIKFDVAALLKGCEELGLLDFEDYKDIQYDQQNEFSGLVKSNEFTVNSHFLGEGEKELNSDSYRHKYLTGFNEEVRTDVPDTQKNIRQRLERLQKTSRIYTPESDELNYGRRLDTDKGLFDPVLNYFESRLCRVRLAAMSPHFQIKPHIDHDPSYITRYHMPLITNDKCTMHVIRHDNGLEREEVARFKADGHLYFLNTGFKHWAENNSEETRLHLIIDVHGQKELEPYVSHK